MAMLWYPGQDVDFLSRLERLEKLVEKILNAKYGLDPLTSVELEEENNELRTRLDDLEENVIQVVANMSQLEERVKS